VGVALEFGVLGPLQVRIDGNVARLGGHRQRALLAILVLRANEPVSTDRLIDELWPENPPARAVHTVQVFISRLRGALGSAGDRLVTRPPGYVLELGSDEIDAARCERLYETARSALNVGDAPRAEALLSEARALWRGPPMADFTYEPFAQATIARLEELRLSCREELIEAQLALGRQAEVVSDLEELVREQPLRERPRGQLMLALYRCGRQAEALEVFQQARRMLVEELAVEPGSALRELEQAILLQDPSLQAPRLPSEVASERIRPGQPDGTDEEEAAPSSLESTAPAPARSQPMVRKTATVLVISLTPVGRTDPELARRAMATAREQAEGIVTRHGGSFVAGLGGELVWVFGIPLAREDDALRALRAADDMRTSLSAATEAGGCRLQTRIGVATGEVVAETTGELFGEPLQEAVSLARAAGSGELLLGDVTRQLASAAARVEQALDGTAWRLVRIEAHRASPVVLATPMVGRDEELSSAYGVFARAARSGEAHLLTLLGDAGVGKSRLAQELLARIGEEATVLTGRCLSYGEGIALWPLREALTRAAGGETRDAIRDFLADAEDADVVADIVATALGLAPAEIVSEQVPWAVRRILELLSNRRTLMLVIEDAHWAQPPVLDLIDYLVDWLRTPTMLLCLGRPELLDARPAWGGGHPRVNSIFLAPLGAGDTLRLLDQQLGGRDLSAAQRTRIVQTAEGNPLFVEQFLQMSAEDPSWDQAQQLPPTIQSLVSARLDRLGPGERAFIECAAVIGREFWPTAVVELLPAEARESAAHHLRALVHRGLIEPHLRALLDREEDEPHRSSLAGEEELRFHHILIRDVAYRGTPKSRRGELHERFAEWLAPHGDVYDEFIGYHLEQAYHYRAGVGRADEHARALATRAGDRLAAAGRRALSRGDAHPAARLLQRAADLLHAGRRRQPDVLIDLGTALGETGDFAAASPLLQAALEQARATGAESTSARALIELSLHRAIVDPSFPVAEMMSVAEQAVDVFTRVGDKAGTARAWQHVATVHWIRSHGGEMELALERALVHAERAGDPRLRSRILGDLARASVIGPRPVADGIRRCHAILERAGDDIVLLAVTATMLGVLEAMQGEFALARQRWERSKRTLESVGLSITVANLQMYSAFVELLAGTPERALSEVADACALFERVGERGRLSTAAALMARLLYAQGRPKECDEYCAISEHTTSDDDVVSQVLWRGTRAKTLARAGRGRAALGLADSAVAMASATDFLMLEGDALSDRAEVFGTLNRPKKAGADRKAASALYERKGITVPPGCSRPVGQSSGASSATSIGTD
jgi:DNA-binding SARP family transcriptional activator/tetratricopeptide (TPR) repeat protein